MVSSTLTHPSHVRSLVNASKKVWSTTIKIPALKVSNQPTTIPLIEDNLDEATSLLVNMLTKHQGKTLVMTGAGISTDSGIPDYRGDEGTYVRNPKHRPILFHELLSSELFRRRYWARAFMGWPKMKQAKPNTSHHVMAWLLEQHYIDHLITQNVDHLHRAAATNTATNSNIIELHGTLYEVECLDCQTIVPREIYQHRLYARNPAFVTHLESQTALKINPDGDVELPDQMSYADFDIPPCRACSSRRMKPKVVFFGENIRKEVTGTAENMVRASTAMLVVGSSLATYSAYRLVRLAKEMGMPIGILCKGPTRADDLASWKIQMACTPVLQQVQQQLLENKKGGKSPM